MAKTHAPLCTRVFQGRLGLAGVGVISVEFVPDEPWLHHIVGAIATVAHDKGPELPVVVGEVGDDFCQGTAVIIVGEEGAVDATAHVGVFGVDAVACVGAEPAPVGGEEPRKIDRDDVFGIRRIGELQVLARMVGGVSCPERTARSAGVPAG